MPRETEKHSQMTIGGKQIGGQRPGGRNQDGCGAAESDDFFLRISHPRVRRGGVHTLRVDIAYTHGSRCMQCACHISPSHLLPSHVSSAVLAVPFVPELFPIRKRGSSALPHERRGVWQRGRIPRTPHAGRALQKG